VPAAFSALETLARVGFVVKGVLYMVVGVLALQVALAAGGRITSASGALSTVLRQPFGRTLLLVAAVGLLGYAVWRVLQGIFDPDYLGTGWGALATRFTLVLRGAIHGVLGYQAIQLYRGLGVSAGGSSEREAAAVAFQWPLGDWLVVVTGVGMIAFAISEVRDAIKGHLSRNMKTADLRSEAGNWAVDVSRFGIGARAIVFGLLGWAVVVAGWSRDPSEVGSVADSLRTLAEQPGALGRWLFGATAAGLVAYGFYEVVHARYLHMRPVR
jgi:hypothetical protein